MATEQFARDFWERAPHSFAHISSAQATYVHSWRRQWLEPLLHLMGSRSLRPCVVDVGIGGGALGVMLLNNYSLNHYIGLDIAQRQLDTARRNLQRHASVERPADDAAAGPSAFSLDLVPVDFSRFSRCSLLVCQAAMQHFPSREDPVEWLRNVDASGIRWLMLQPRYSSTPIFSDWATPGSREKQKGSVANATRFDATVHPRALAQLKYEQLRWSSPRISTYIFSRSRSCERWRRRVQCRSRPNFGRDDDNHLTRRSPHEVEMHASSPTRGLPSPTTVRRPLLVLSHWPLVLE